MLYSFNLVPICNPDIVFHLIRHLNRQAIRRVEHYLNMVGTILVTCANSQRGLLLNRLCKFIPGSSHERRLEEFWSILLKRGLQALPRLQIIADRCCRGLLRQRSAILPGLGVRLHY